jgi:predicted transcriptional regulator
LTMMIKSYQWCLGSSIGEYTMDDVEVLEKLFFELSSESRLAILRKLLGESLKTQEMARRLDVTATEAFRQLQRLTDAGLVQRQPEGSYTITSYGRLVLHLTSSLGVVSKHREYFLRHDFWRLPIQFIDRIGEVSGADLIMDTMGSISRVEQIIGGAEEYLWGIGEGRFTENMGKTAEEQSGIGVEYRVLSPLPPTRIQSLENRTLSDVPVVLILTEKEALICLRFADGRMDYAGFSGKDPVFLLWVRDLFLYYWDKE